MLPARTLRRQRLELLGQPGGRVAEGSGGGDDPAMSVHTLPGSQDAAGPVGTVTKQLSRALERLREQLKPEIEPCQPIAKSAIS